MAEQSTRTVGSLPKRAQRCIRHAGRGGIYAARLSFLTGFENVPRTAILEGASVGLLTRSSAERTLQLRPIRLADTGRREFALRHRIHYRDRSLDVTQPESMTELVGKDAG